MNYTDHELWTSDVVNARKAMEEIEKAKPEYYAFYQDIERLNNNNWEKRRMVSSMTGPTKERNVNVFMEMMEKWTRLSFPDSQKVWKLVKGYNSMLNPDAYGNKFETKKIYDTLKSIQERTK